MYKVITFLAENNDILQEELNKIDGEIITVEQDMEDNYRVIYKGESIEPEK
jgi:hypothetical protein